MAFVLGSACPDLPESNSHVIFEALAIAFAIGYFLFLRLDFLPDIFPILGYTDDLIIGLFLILVPGAWLFIKFAPQDIVQEHVDRISQGN